MSLGHQRHPNTYGRSSRETPKNVVSWTPSLQESLVHAIQGPLQRAFDGVCPQWWPFVQHSHRSTIHHRVSSQSHHPAPTLLTAVEMSEETPQLKSILRQGGGGSATNKERRAAFSTDTKIIQNRRRMSSRRFLWAEYDFEVAMSRSKVWDEFGGAGSHCWGDWKMEFPEYEPPLFNETRAQTHARRRRMRRALHRWKARVHEMKLKQEQEMVWRTSHHRWLELLQCNNGAYIERANYGRHTLGPIEMPPGNAVTLKMYLMYCGWMGFRPYLAEYFMGGGSAF